MKKILLFLFIALSIATNAQHVRVNQIKSTGQPEGRIVVTDGASQKLKISTFNLSDIGLGTVTNVTATSPLFSSGGTQPNISIQAATTTQTGSMSAYDKAKLDSDTDQSSLNELNTDFSFNNLSRQLSIIDAGGTKTVNIPAGDIVNVYYGTVTITSTTTTITWPQNFSDVGYRLEYDVIYYETIDGKNVPIKNAIYNPVKTVSGFSFSVDTIAGYVYYSAMDSLNLYPITFGNYLAKSDSATLSGYATNYKLNSYKLNSDSVNADGYTRRDRLASQIATRVERNVTITPMTNTKITYDAKGLVTGSTSATASDIVNTPTGTITSTTVQSVLNELDTEKVPYSGATANVDIGTYELLTDAIKFNTSPSITPITGMLYWDNIEKTVQIVHDATAGVTGSVNKEVYVTVVNKTGTQINDGQVVYCNGAQGNRPIVDLAKADNISTALWIGIATQNIANNDEGNVTIIGEVHGYNTSGFAAGDLLYISPSTAGQLTNVMPSSPNYNGSVAKVLNSTNNGTILVYQNSVLALDGTMAANSDMVAPSQKAVKTYADAKVSDTAYSNSWDAVTTIAPSKNSIYDKIVTLESATYTATTMTVNTGTLTQGTVNDTWSVGGTDVIITESSGSDPLRVTFAFPNVQRLTAFTFYGNYNGGAGHVSFIEAYNTVTTNWDKIGELGTSTSKQWYSFGIFNSAVYISGGNVQVRINHQGNGINTHTLTLDYVIVNFGGASGGTSITASQVDYVPTGDITATNVQNAVSSRAIASASYIARGTSNSGLPNAQFTGSLATGILKNTTTTGDLSIAVAGDFPILNQNTTGSAGSVANSQIIKFDTGTTEGTDLYTFNGSASKTIDIKAGSNITFTKAAGSITIASTASGGTGEIWTSLTGTYSSTTQFYFTGTDKDAKLVEMSLFTCTNSTGATRRIGYVKTATNSSGTITCNVVTDTDLASGDKDFKVAYNQKVFNYYNPVKVPGVIVADASYSQGSWTLDVPVDSYLLPVDASVRTPASGSGAALTFNVYKGATNLFSAAPDMTTNSVLRSQRPTTNTISAADNVSFRILTSAGATNKAEDFQAKLYIVPQSIFTAFGFNWLLTIGLISVALGGSFLSIRINKKLIIVVILFCSFQGFGQIKAYYRMDGNSNDASGNAYNGTNNVVTFSQSNGKLNQGAGFNGTSSYILLSNSAKGGNSLTVSLWFYQSSLSAGVFWSESASVFAGIEVSATGQLGLLNKTSATTFQEFFSAAGICTAGKWHHAVYVYDSTTGYLTGYLDGVPVISQYRTGTQSYLNTLADNAIGCYSYNNHANRASFFNGSIDEFKIVNGAWSSAMVKNEYARVLGFFAMKEVKKHLDTIRVKLTLSNYLYQTDFKKLIDLAA